MLSQAVMILHSFFGVWVASYSHVCPPVVKTVKIRGEMFKWQGKVKAALISNSVTSTIPVKYTPHPRLANTHRTDHISESRANYIFFNVK